jgi:hypothetical protein
MIKLTILFALLTSLSAHAYDYQMECVQSKSWFENQLGIAETAHANALQAMNNSKSPWKQVFYNDKDRAKIEALVQEKHFGIMMKSTSTTEAMSRAESLHEIPAKENLFDQILFLGKREYTSLRRNLISAKVDLAILKGLHEDCAHAQEIYDAAYQSAYLGNKEYNEARRKELTANLFFHSLEKLENAAAKGEIDRLSEPKEEVVQIGYKKI